MSSDGAGADATCSRPGVRRLRESEIQRAAPGGRSSPLRSQRALRVYLGSRVAGLVSEDVGAPASCGREASRVVTGEALTSCGLPQTSTAENLHCRKSSLQKHARSKCD